MTHTLRIEVSRHHSARSLLALSPTLHFITTSCFVLLSQSINLPISPPYYGNHRERPFYTSSPNLSSSPHRPQPPSILQSSLVSPTCCFQTIVRLLLCLWQVSSLTPGSPQTLSREEKVEVGREREKGWGCLEWTVVGVAALWVVCFLWGWDTMPPVFRQAHRSLFYNRGGAAINGQMMWTTLGWFTVTNSPLQAQPHLLLLLFFCFLPSPPSFPPHILFSWTRTRAAEGMRPHRSLMDTRPHKYSDTHTQKFLTYIMVIHAYTHVCWHTPEQTLSVLLLLMMAQAAHWNMNWY